MFHQHYCILGYSGTVTRNKQITTIPNFGPEYSVTFDITVHSAGGGWSNILHFTTGANCCNLGDRIPAIFYNSAGYIRIDSSVNERGNYKIHYDIDLNKWYHIEIAQTKMNGKVSEINNFSW